MRIGFPRSRNPVRIVIVRDMWLTGFDAPCLRTMYADKPMQGHGLMQVIEELIKLAKDLDTTTKTARRWGGRMTRSPFTMPSPKSLKCCKRWVTRR